MSEAAALIVAIFGSALGLSLLFLAGRLYRNRHMSFSEHDYQSGIAFDRKKNRIITTRRLRDGAIRRLLS